MDVARQRKQQLRKATVSNTYNTTHPRGFSPHGSKTVATFHFTSLNNNWSVGHLEVDATDFQASTFGSVVTTFNDIIQNFAFNNGFPNTSIRFFTLTDAVIDSINANGELTIAIDCNNSVGFYDFDYLKISDVAASISEP